MKNDWISCNGIGEVGGALPSAPKPAAPSSDLSRRALLVGGLLGAVGWLGKQSALAQVSFSPDRDNRNVLVVIFLRGGQDGLNVLAPFEEDAYYSSRPTLAIPRGELTDLDGFFGMGPDMAPLRPLWDSGQLAFVHAVGSQDESRSHFEAMSAMEHGNESMRATSLHQSGWLARYLNATKGGSSPLRALALTSVMPDSLGGASQALAIESLTQYRLRSPNAKREDELLKTLEAMYSEPKDVLEQAGADTLSVLRKLRETDPGDYKPANGAAYPEAGMDGILSQSNVGRALKEVAFLVKQDVGLEVACVDFGGWDTHVGQGTYFGGFLAELSAALAAFVADLGQDSERVTVMVQTEFGRRVAENSGFGTDHGRGGVMWLLGGGVQGGKVYGEWPGLTRDVLEGPGDLPVTTDYRSVLGELLEKRMAPGVSGDVFPEFAARPVGAFSG